MAFGRLIRRPKVSCFRAKSYLLAGPIVNHLHAKISSKINLPLLLKSRLLPNELGKPPLRQPGSLKKTGIGCWAKTMSPRESDNIKLEIQKTSRPCSELSASSFNVFKHIVMIVDGDFLRLMVCVFQCIPEAMFPTITRTTIPIKCFRGPVITIVPSQRQERVRWPCHRLADEVLGRILFRSDRLFARTGLHAGHTRSGRSGARALLAVCT
jgi:hypothetical protein